MTSHVKAARAADGEAEDTDDKAFASIEQPEAMDGPHARYVLVVLLLVYAFSFMDRQLLVILAEDIKADLELTDADLGFLTGTAFAVFYATFGIVLARLADLWNRRKLIACSLGFWSLMTAFSGLVKSFLPLVACRFGVAVGEAGASPAAYSLLYDYFSPKVRTTVLAIYGCGAVVGSALGLWLGGVILDSWNAAYPVTGAAPFGLRGWQAAFIIVGLPGLLVALLAWRVKEPPRGRGDGLLSVPHPHPFREVLVVLCSMVPLVNLWVMAGAGPRRGAMALNLFVGVVLIALVTAMIAVTGDRVQWLAVGIGFYSAFSWVQTLALRDPVAFGMIFKCKALAYTISAIVAQTFFSGGFGFWSVLYVQRQYDVGASDAGAMLGLASGSMGLVGMFLGGVIADRLSARNPKGKLYVCLAALVGMVLSAAAFLWVDSLVAAYVTLFCFYLTAMLAGAPGTSTVNDLVLPRSRATSAAFMMMTASLLGGALGPYMVGHISDAMVTVGTTQALALQQAIGWSLVVGVLGVGLYIMAMRYIAEDKASLLPRARALGEDI